MTWLAQLFAYHLLRGAFLALGWLFLAIVDPSANERRINE
jgi:hypothetical protein